MKPSKLSTPRCLVIASALTILLYSCRKSTDVVTPDRISLEQSSSATVEHPFQQRWKVYLNKLQVKRASIRRTDEYYKTLLTTRGKAVQPSTCTASELGKVVNSYFDAFEFWDYVLLADYVWINQLSSISDQSKQQFGRRGEYTHLVTKHQKRLTSFWKLQQNVRVNGQHSETLGNRDKVAEVFILYTGASKTDAYYIADQVISMNEESKVFPESPLLSMDGFATTDGLIVIGDGLIESVTTTEVSSDVVVAGLLAHEWAHQVQFANMKKWYGVTAESRPQTPEFTRQMELEADFFAGYFLTHKHGGVYNWKRVAQFNRLFFNLGDCEFMDAGHHGTPLQRQKASELGYLLASQTLPKGYILAADKVHQQFMLKRSTIYK